MNSAGVGQVQVGGGGSNLRFWCILGDRIRLTLPAADTEEWPSTRNRCSAFAD